jgi:insertion element IS1 protein InsB
LKGGEVGLPKYVHSDVAKSTKAYRQQATFYTDQYVVYEGVIPAAQHRAINKKARKTNHIERFNNTLRQRVSRLVRSALSFSKKLDNHILAVFQTTTMLRNLEKGKVHVEAEQDRADVDPPHYSRHLGRIHELAGSDSYGWNGGQEIKKVQDAVGKYRSRPE